jgi:uncharacterized protein YndB with AHSA1/START domain/DNA-binding transcriptional ArsR family regulator
MLRGMDGIVAALGDAARWRMVELLAERPRSVGELAELTGLRQPQTTKHLQTLARAGIVTVVPLGQRRVYALEAPPLDELARRLGELAAQAAAGDRSVLERYRAAIAAESAAVDGWADDRTFTFERLLAAPRAAVWRQWTDAALLAAWWAPPSLTVSECVLEPRPGGRVVLEYRDAEGTYRSEGGVLAATAPRRLTFDLSVLDARGAVAFTGHYDLTLVGAEGGTRLHLDLRITGTTAAAAPAIAGIETGWGQVLDNLTATLAKEP